MKNYKILKLDAIKDDRGKLVALESNKEIPFEIKGCIIYLIQIQIFQEEHMHIKFRASAYNDEWFL